MQLLKRIYCWLRCKYGVWRFCRVKRCSELRRLLEWFCCLDLCIRGV